MSSKRPTAKSSSTTDEWKITDEWGIYDPAKAGIPALFARLGRPILRAAPTNSRRERRRALRPERTSEGVGLAIAEARRRADGGAAHDLEQPPVGTGGNPARAMRLALRAQAAVNAMGTPAAQPFVPPAAPLDPPPVAEAVAPVTLEAPVAKKRQARRATPRVVDAPARQLEPAPAAAPTTPAAKTRTRKASTKAPARRAAAVEPAAPAAQVASESKASMPPAPSPRRPRGPVPLAAWAHAAVEPPKVESRRSDKRGFWRGIFRIPAEVALVEYAHGAKIHRLLIEAGDDRLPDFI